MQTTWSLDVLYRGYDDPKWQADCQALTQKLVDFTELVGKLSSGDPVQNLEQALLCLEQIESLSNGLANFAGLQSSANTQDAESASMEGKIFDLLAELNGPQSVLSQFVAHLPDLDACIAKSELLQQYEYLLHSMAKDSRYLLSEQEERLLSKMNLSGAVAWSNLQANLTSSVPVECDGKTLTLSTVRNMAYDPNPAVRKAAYSAELACYDRIKDPVAFCLNSIKLQVLNECKLRGFASPLAQALYKSHMKPETLHAMWMAIDEYLPTFWSYLRAKAEALGHENGLPWYDLFAPMGKNDRRYTVEEARDTLLELFAGFDEELHDMAEQAFAEGWIDFYPREGKVGGAFDCGLPTVQQSRVLTNFDGAYGDLVTLAHELGHAFHDRMTFSHRPLNLSYSMPVAETASTFNENIVNHAALERAKSKEEKLAILESMLMDTTQIICDIYSRYLFETAVFENRSEEFMPADKLCDMMLQAQKTAYGDGLDQSVLHPYMWICKSHYYSGDISFYNFPYAFGGLFARGLYALYQRDGAAFVPRYKALLHATTVTDVEDAAAMAGIDLTDVEFWRSSLQSLAQDVDAFIALLKD